MTPRQKNINQTDKIFIRIDKKFDNLEKTLQKFHTINMKRFDRIEKNVPLKIAKIIITEMRKMFDQMESRLFSAVNK